MSRVTGTLIAAIVLMSFGTTAQAQDDLILLDTPAWRIDAGSNSWFINDGTARGGAVNPATGHVLVATRTGGVNIVVLDAATGDSLSVLDVTGISGGVYPFNELAITADGQIFGANLTLDGNAKIYYWADEASMLAVAFDGLISAHRYGDAVGVAGTGTDVEFYISGSNNPNVAKLLWDGSALTLDNLLDVGTGRARLGIDPVAGTETAWINGVGTDPALISTVDGSIITEVTGFPDATGSGDITYIKAGAFDVIVTGPNLNGFGEFSMFDVTDPADFGMPLKTENFDTNPNTNATAFVDFDEANNRLVVMASNNAIVSYPLTIVHPPVVENIAVENWRIDADSNNWFASDDATRGGDYNPVTDHVLVVSRSGGLKIVALDAATGDSLGLGDVTGISGGTFPLSEIAITDDGQIFGANLTLNASSSNAKIYYWADEASSPAVIFDGAISAHRYGDGIGVGGSGNAVQVYLSGSGSPNVAVFDWDGTALSAPTLIPVDPAGRARFGLDPVPGEDQLWVNAPNGPSAALISSTDGTVLAEINEAIANGSGDLEYFQSGLARFVATGTNFNGLGEFGVYNVTDVIYPWTDPAEWTLAGKTPGFPNTNSNGAGFVAYDASRHALIVGVTNNAIVSYDLSGSSFTGTDPVINEFVFNHTGSDTNEYLEIFGDPSLDYSLFTLLIIEGDEGSDNGAIDRAYPVGTTDGEGIWWTGFINGEMENGSQTVLLVEGFTGNVGDDLDADNDGTPEVAPWSRIVDEIAVSDGDTAPVLYSSVVLLPDFDGGVFGAGGASRVPNGTDTDTPADWRRNDFSGEGIPGFSNTVAVGEVANTPGLVNPGGAVATDEEGDLPKEFKLSQNYPNPFNPVTNIQFDLPKTADVRLTVHDVLGRQVAVLVDSQMPAGRHDVLFDGQNLASGTYVYRIEAGDYVKALTFTLIK